MSYITEIKRHVLTYTILVWNKLFEIADKSRDDPFEAYEMLKSLLPLLPQRVIEKVNPLINEFESNMCMSKKVVSKSLKDSISSNLVFSRYARKTVKSFIHNVLYIISSELEKMGLKYETQLVEAGRID
jgi:hypothetical protein